MARDAPGMRRIALRLVHDGVQPGPALPEALRFGLQDGKGDVHPGLALRLALPGGAQAFDLTLAVKGEETRAGPSCPGPSPMGRRRGGISI
jgi:hypothetical protein